MALDFPATRWSLIARLPGQPQETAVLVALYADAIGAYLQAKLPDERSDRLEDVIQEVLLNLLGKPEALARAQPGSGSRFRYFIMHLAWQSALNHLRYQRRREHRSLDALMEGGGTPGDVHPQEAPADQHDAMDRAWAISVVRQALDDAEAATAAGRLDGEALRVLTANLIDGRSLREVAADTGLSLATCSRRLAQGRQFLQRAMADRLRLAGELACGEPPEAAGARLIELLSSS